MLRIRVAGADAVLHPSGAIILSAEQTLLIADAHFGKAVSFRKLGVPVPSGTTTENLDELSAVVAATKARRIVFLGDFLHSRHAHSAATLAARYPYQRAYLPVNRLAHDGTLWNW